MTAPQRTGRALHAILAVAGVITAAYLLQVHADVAAGGAAGGLCNLGENLQCEGAASSRYATLLGVPIAALGLGFYLAALAATALGWKPNDRAVQAPDVLAPLYLGSVVYSAFLAVVSVTQIGSICPGCAVLYAVNAGGLAATWLWSGRAPWAAAGAAISAVPAWGGLLGVPMALTFVLGAGASAAWNAGAEPDGPAPDAPILSESLLAHLRADHAPSAGPEDAPVTIVEFSDFQCPFCARLAATLHEVKDARPETVRVVFRQFPLGHHEHADAAARATLCADEQGRFWELHDAFFANQRALDEEGRIDLAQDVGIDTDILRACMEDAATAAMVAADIEAGRALGVTGTPAFFVNGRKYVGALPVEDILRIVDEAAAE